MGLDVTFSKSLAEKAGMVITKEHNGTPEEIKTVKSDPECDYNYLKWLETEEDVVNIPTTDYKVVGFVFDDKIQCRANKWGRVYAPLTQWLSLHEIEWGEF